MNFYGIPTNLLPHYIRLMGTDANIVVSADTQDFDNGTVNSSTVKIPVRGIQAFYKGSEIDGVTIKSTDTQFIIVPDPTVVEGTNIEINGLVRVVKSIEKTVVDNIELVYILRLR